MHLRAATDACCAQQYVPHSIDDDARRGATRRDASRCRQHHRHLQRHPGAPCALRRRRRRSAAQRPERARAAAARVCVRVTRAARSLQDMNIIDAPAPRPDQLPMGSSRNTWPNIVNNKVLLSVLCLCPARVRRSCLRYGVRRARSPPATRPTPHTPDAAPRAARRHSSRWGAGTGEFSQALGPADTSVQRGNLLTCVRLVLASPPTLSPPLDVAAAIPSHRPTPPCPPRATRTAHHHLLHNTILVPQEPRELHPRLHGRPPPRLNKWSVSCWWPGTLLRLRMRALCDCLVG